MTVFTIDLGNYSLRRVFKFENGIPKAMEIHDNRLIIDDLVYDINNFKQISQIKGYQFHT